jgi:hypothetical protein
MPSDQPGGSERGADGRFGLLAGCWQIVGLAAACSHQGSSMVASACGSILHTIF